MWEFGDFAKNIELWSFLNIFLRFLHSRGAAERIRQKLSGAASDTMV